MLHRHFLNNSTTTKTPGAELPELRRGFGDRDGTALAIARERKSIASEGPQKSGLKIFANMSLPGCRDASETLERLEVKRKIKLWSAVR